ncbi:MAG: hypothetical protein AAGA18_11415 [Verrucomicrobiota bacterium]
MRSWKLTIISILFLLTLTALWSQAQDNTVAQQQEDLRQLGQTALDGSLTDLNKDIQEEIYADSGMLDLLIVKDFKTRMFLSLFNDLEYHSNANFDDGDGEGSFVHDIAIQFYTTTNMPNETFTIDTLTRVNNLIYEGVDEQNRWGVFNRIYGTYHPEYKWIPDVFFGPEVFRYQSWDTGKRTSASIGPTIGVSDYFTLNSKTNTGIYYLYKYNARFYQPGEFDHHSNLVNIGIRQFFFENKLMIEPYYSFYVYDYMHSNRLDLQHYAGINVSYRFSDEFTAKLGFTWTNNESSLADNEADYEDYSGGMTTSLTYRF